MILYENDYVIHEDKYLDGKIGWTLCKVTSTNTTTQKFNTEVDKSVPIIPVGKNAGFWALTSDITKVTKQDNPEYFL